MRGRTDPAPSSHPEKLELTQAWRDEPFQLLASATEKAFLVIASRMNE